MRIVPATVNQVFVESLYENILQRDADPGGLQGFTSYLDAGGAAATVIQSIEHSPEYQAAYVTNLYGGLLGRDISPGELQLNMTNLAGGASLRQHEGGVLGSPEYFAASGGTTQGFLNSIYLDELGRSIDPSGQAAWSAALAGGASRTEVAMNIINSIEKSTGVVTSFYENDLQREPDPGGLSAWVNRIAEGAQPEAVETSFFASAELANQLTNWANQVANLAQRLVTDLANDFQNFVSSTHPGVMSPANSCPGSPKDLVKTLQNQFPNANITPTSFQRTIPQQADLMLEQALNDPQGLLDTYKPKGGAPTGYATAMKNYLNSTPVAGGPTIRDIINDPTNPNSASTRAAASDKFASIVKAAVKGGAKVSDHLKGNAVDIAVPLSDQAAILKFLANCKAKVNTTEAGNPSHWHISYALGQRMLPPKPAYDPDGDTDDDTGQSGY